MAEAKAALVLEHAWKYFQLHATQRIAVFNFFVIASGLLFNGEVAAIRFQDGQAWLGVPGGILMMLLALVFWKLDQRNASLVKSAERAMADAEHAALPPNGRIFADEAARDRGPWTWTVGFSFRFLFVVVAVVGLMSAALAIRQLSAKTVALTNSGGAVQ